MIYYSQIENLPEDHPLVKQFMAELEAEDAAYEAAYEADGEVASIAPDEDEGSLDHFNRYIAGDR